MCDVHVLWLVFCNGEKVLGWFLQCKDVFFDKQCKCTWVAKVGGKCEEAMGPKAIGTPPMVVLGASVMGPSCRQHGKVKKGLLSLTSVVVEQKALELAQICSAHSIARLARASCSWSHCMWSWC